MAGGLVGTKDPKKLQILKNNSNEILKDSKADFSPPPPAKLSLKGILGLGQTIEFGKPVQKSQEIVNGLYNVSHETNVLYSNHQIEMERALKELRHEIAQLASTLENVSQDVDAIILNEIPEINEYQVSIFVRLKNLIIAAKESISETGIWVQAFAAKKKKKNYFWNKAKDKKHGGTNFMFSDESSVARSVG